MVRTLLAIAVSAFVAACGSSPTPVASNDITASEPAPLPTGPTEAERLCQQQIQAWQVALADFRSGEQQRQSSCSTLANHQIELNDQYRRLRSEWAFTAPEYENCLRLNTQADRQRCLSGLCTFIEIGGYRCADLQNPLNAIWDGQDQLFREADQNCCTIAVASRLYSALNSAPPARTCTAPPQPPAQPDCAQGTMNVSNTM